ncbi:PH domain-containing protein [Haloferax sp. S1W]|uniref:PH domain-containing protein n=1 Tax=Haloferax sp. S1W TaxID=3377110 RepID=UPI0037C90962
METEFDWLTLDDDEEVLWADTPHPYSLVPALIVGIPLSLVIVGIPLLVGSYLSFKNTNYVVTSQALYKKTGVFSRSVQRIEFDKVQDTSYSQTFFGAQFGYGTVDISTAGGSGVEMSFQDVAEPQSLQSQVNERLKRHRKGDTGEKGKAAVLDDILSELRAIREAVEDTATSSAVDGDATTSAVEGDDTPSGVNGDATSSPTDGDDTTSTTKDDDTPPWEQSSDTDAVETTDETFEQSSDTDAEHTDDQLDPLEPTEFEFDPSVTDDR